MKQIGAARQKVDKACLEMGSSPHCRAYIRRHACMGKQKAMLSLTDDSRELDMMMKMHETHSLPAKEREIENGLGRASSG